MYFQDASSNGPTPGPEPSKLFRAQSSSLPFAQSQSLASFSGPTYVTAQSLVQQVAYLLSNKLFTYSPESFDLDSAVKEWSTQGQANANGYTTDVQPMQIRNGAGSIALGYIFSKEFDLKKRHIPQGMLAPSSSLQFLRPALEQLSLLYSVANPFVAHIAAVDYAGAKQGGFVTDYAAAMSVADEFGLGLLASQSAHESQHIALLATVFAQIFPTLHIYDGVKVGRETTQVANVLDRTALNHAHQSILEIAGCSESKHLDIEGRTLHLLNAFNEALGTMYRLFEYAGHPSPEAVLVTFGTIESSLATQVAIRLTGEGRKVGIITVRVYRPFVEEEFLKVLPSSTQKIGVLGQVHNGQAVSEPGSHSQLYEDVLAALALARISTGLLDVQELKYSRSQTWTPISIAAAFQMALGKPLFGKDEQLHPAPFQLLDSSVQQYSFWDTDDSPSANAAMILGQALAKDSIHSVSLSTTYDNLVHGGVRRTDIRKSSKAIESGYSIDVADAAVVGDVKLLEKFNILGSIKEGGKLILKLAGVKDEDVENKLVPSIRGVIAARGIKLFLIDTSASENAQCNPLLESHIVQTAFLRVALPKAEGIGLQKLAAVNSHIDILERIASELGKTLREVEVPKSWTETDENQEEKAVPRDIKSNSFVPFGKVESQPTSILCSWQKAAKGLLFKEAYGTKRSLRPDLVGKAYTVHVKENRRLTPITYDRNIFHIEFDLDSSGLKYDIGEALGIHAENDPQEVMDFIRCYGLDPEEVVEVSSRDDPSVFENRTVYQSLVQNVDIFGRPPKRFYEALSEFADDENERKELSTLGGSEGAMEFKRRAEVDTIMYADILLEFPSAHPSFHDIVRIVSPMKRREYSIASCQAVTPTSVALMVVTVGWADPRGRDRFGQATRYLNKLRPGAPVTVSVKPSVMKLPPKSTQPIIMAGLGTGLAPFRAFVQHRAMEKAQGKDIGSVLLYMGSRHQREEYCYGEEWEAYQDAGVITLLGRAFSRDQPHKIYIQDRMRQTMNDIIQAYIKDQGAFYLCGPTWPVPDVTNVLEEAIATHAKVVGRKVDPRKEIERLKDELRYVLEVY